MRYTVPQMIDPDKMADILTVRFRVGAVFRDKSLVLYYDGHEIRRTKKRVMAPGEMEQIVLTKQSLQEYPDLKEIAICAED